MIEASNREELMAYAGVVAMLPKSAYKEMILEELNRQTLALKAADAAARGLVVVPDDGDFQPPEEVDNYYLQSEMMALPPVEFLVPGFVPAHGVTQLVAVPGAGKSFLALEWAQQLALAGKRVLYVAAEGWQGFGGRFRAWTFVNGPHPAEKNLAFLSPGIVPDLRDTDSVERMLAGIQSTWSERFDLVILDTLARTMSGSENDAEVIGEVIKACNRVQERTGAAVLLIHHMGWDGKRQRGSSALYGACDAVVHMTLEDREQKISKVYVEKMKDGRSGDEFYVQMYAPDPDNPDDGTMRVIARPEATAKAEAASNFTKEVLVQLGEHGPVGVNRLREILGCKAQRLQDELTALRLSGQATFEDGPRKSKLWKLPE